MPSRHTQSTPTALSIAASDSGCGAGIQADLLTFAACGVFGTTAIAALTAQNPRSVTHCMSVEPNFLKAQIDQVLAFFPITAIKTGMLFSKPLIATVVHSLNKVDIPVIVDPVMISSSGDALLEPAAVETFIHDLLPLAHLITPNLDEVAAIMGIRPESVDEMEAIAIEMATRFDTAVLLKGGHLQHDHLVDVLVYADEGKTDPTSKKAAGAPDTATRSKDRNKMQRTVSVKKFEAQRMKNLDTHGSGCTLSSAIAAHLAKGECLEKAVVHGHQYLQKAIRQSLHINDKAYINHWPT